MTPGVTLRRGVEVRERIGDVPRDAWNALVGDGSPFLDWDFLHALEDTGCATARKGWRPLHLTTWTDAPLRRLVAAMPLYLKGHSHGEFVYDWAWAEAAQRLGRPYYPKLVAAVPFSPVAGARLLVAPGEDRAAHMQALLAAADDLARELGASGLHVLYPDLAEAEELERLGLALRPGLRHRFRNEGYATFADFLGRFTAKKRAQIRRERLEVERAGITFETRTGDDVRPELVDAMHACYRATVDKYPWGHPYLNRPFFARIVDTFRRHLHLVVARKEGRVIGMSINVHKGGALYGRYWGGEDGHAFLHFSACYYEPIDWCIQHGVGVFDPGAGGEHKAPRGFLVESQPSAHRLHDPVLASLLGRAMERERAMLSSSLDEIRAQDSPFKRA